MSPYLARNYSVCDIINMTFSQGMFEYFNYYIFRFLKFEAIPRILKLILGPDPSPYVILELISFLMYYTFVMYWTVRTYFICLFINLTFILRNHCRYGGESQKDIVVTASKPSKPLFILLL